MCVCVRACVWLATAVPTVLTHRGLEASARRIALDVAPDGACRGHGDVSASGVLRSRL